MAKHSSEYSVLLSVYEAVHDEDRFFNTVNQNSVHATGRRVVMLAVNIDGPELNRQRLFFRLRCASQKCRFDAEIILLPKSRRGHLNTSATSLLKRVRELQHSRFVKRRTKDLQPYG